MCFDDVDQPDVDLLGAKSDGSAPEWDGGENETGQSLELWPAVSQWSRRESNPSLYQAKWCLNCCFVTARSRSVPLVTCGYAFGS